MFVYRCPNCSREFQSATEGTVQCPACDAAVEVHRPPQDGAPWDRREQGVVQSYFQTIKLSFLKPVYFFEGVARSDVLGSPLVFALINAYVVALLAAAYQLGFQMFIAGANIAANLEALTSPLAALSAPLALIVALSGVLLIVPLLTVIGLFITSGIYHLCLMILRATTRPFVHTFRVACYATGPQLLQILPLAGGMVAGIWQLILTILGLKVVHRTTYGRTVLAVFLPLILCCGLVTLFVAVVAGGVVGAILSAAPQ